MSRLNETRLIKEKLIQKSIEQNKSRANFISMKDIPWYWTSKYGFYSSISIIIGTFMSIAMIDAVNPFATMAVFAALLFAVMDSFSCFYPYKKACNETKEHFKNGDYSELIDKLNLEDIKNDMFIVSKNFNHELINVIQSMGASDFDKNTADQFYSYINNLIEKKDLERILKEPSLLEIQKREKSVTSSIYIYSLVLRIEEFLKEPYGWIFIEKSDSKSLSDTIKMQHQYILNAKNDDLEKEIKKEMMEKMHEEISAKC